MKDGPRRNRQRAAPPDVTKQGVPPMAEIALNLVADAVYAKDGEGRYVFVNAAAAEILGRPAADLLGRTDAEVLPRRVAAVLAEAEGRIGAAGATDGQPLQWPGSSGPLEWHGVAQGSGIIGVLRAGGNRQAEQALRDSKARLSGVIESAMDAIITVDEQQRVRLFNRAAEAMFGVPAAEVMGQTLDRFIPLPSRAAHSEMIRSFGRTGVTSRSMTSPGILKAVRSDGTEFPIEASISQVEVSGQKLYTVILRDITERKRQEEQLKRHQEVIRELSTPVLNLADRLLLVPIIGELDGARAAQLTDHVLQGIRANRAQAVVVDLTGVAAVNVDVAALLLRATDAARLLGATVVLTGLSRQISQALVETGLDLTQLIIAGDLKRGIEYASSLL